MKRNMHLRSKPGPGMGVAWRQSRSVCCAAGGAGSEHVLENCETERGKANKEREKKKNLLQDLLVHRMLYFSICIIFPKNNHRLYKEITSKISKVNNTLYCG